MYQNKLHQKSTLKNKLSKIANRVFRGKDKIVNMSVCNKLDQKYKNENNYVILYWDLTIPIV